MKRIVFFSIVISGFFGSAFAKMYPDGLRVATRVDYMATKAHDFSPKMWSDFASVVDDYMKHEYVLIKKRGQVFLPEYLARDFFSEINEIAVRNVTTMQQLQKSSALSENYADLASNYFVTVPKDLRVLRAYRDRLYKISDQGYTASRFLGSHQGDIAKILAMTAGVLHDIFMERYKEFELIV